LCTHVCDYSVLSLSAQRIHITEASYLALEKLGGYVTSMRGEMQIKVSVSAMQQVYLLFFNLLRSDLP